MQPGRDYFFAPPGWDCASPNPFTPDGSYGRQWSAFCLLARDDDQYFTGQSGSGPFSARFGRQVPGLPARLADFLRYERRHDRAVILSFPPEIDPAGYVAQALARTSAAEVVRPSDPPVLVHATSAAAWASIQAGGELKAAALLEQPPRRPGPPTPIEDYLSHEPAEYREYIMFGELESCGPEMVVASYQAGTFVYDVNAVFTPGVRLYFDNHRIIRDGLSTRDGLHVMKVHRRLPLRPYLLQAVSVDAIDPRGRARQWTLKDFVEGANQVFRAR